MGSPSGSVIGVVNRLPPRSGACFDQHGFREQILNLIDIHASLRIRQKHRLHFDARSGRDGRKPLIDRQQSQQIQDNSDGAKRLRDQLPGAFSEIFRPLPE